MNRYLSQFELFDFCLLLCSKGVFFCKINLYFIFLLVHLNKKVILLIGSIPEEVIDTLIIVCLFVCLKLKK